jgi:hypothetical protein
LEVAGRAFFDVGSMFVGGGEANAVAKGSKIAAEAEKAAGIANVASKAEKAAGIANVASKAGKVTEVASTAGKVTEVAEATGKTGKASEVAADTSRAAKGEAGAAQSSGVTKSEKASTAKELTPERQQMRQDGESLQKTLPKRQQVPVEVDPALHGNTVQVHYSMDKKGQLADVHIKAGPEATARDIQLHSATVKRMQQYSGMSRHVQRMKDHIHGWISKNGTPPVGSKAWEAQLEVNKLPKIIEDRANRLAKGGLDKESQLHLEKELSSLKEQMATHEKTLKAMDRDPGRGFVAAESNGSKLAKEQKLPPAEDGYHWTQDKNGKLRYDRNPGRTDLPRMEHDPATGKFVERATPQKTPQAVSKPVDRVATPGEQVGKLKSYKTDADVPAHYRNDPRFKDLAGDPDHGGAVSSPTRAEAMAGLEAESKGLIPGPIKRGPKGTEFYDSQGRPWDVKAPPSPKLEDKWPFDTKQIGGSIQKELSLKATPKDAPPGTFPHEKTGLPEARRVILDSSYMTKGDHKALWEWLNHNLTSKELSNIVEVKVKP